jgi:hypothetical protein
MKFIDTERQLVDIFTKPLDSSRFASLRGGGGGFGVSPRPGLRLGGPCDLSCTLVSFSFLLHFLHTQLSHFVSSVILACIYSIMLITVLG